MCQVRTVSLIEGHNDEWLFLFTRDGKRSGGLRVSSEALRLMTLLSVEAISDLVLDN